MRQVRRRRLFEPSDLDAVAEQQANDVRRGLRVIAGNDHNALEPIRRGFCHGGAAEIVVIEQPVLAILGGRFERRQGRNVVMGDAVAQRRDRAVVAPSPEFRAAIGLVRHAGGALERRPLVPIAHVEEIEHPADEVLPAVFVECRRVAPAIRIEPLGGLRRQIHVHGLSDRREEKRRCRRVMVHEHLRVPA